MKLLSADDMREFNQSKKTNNSEELKEALTIRSRVEVSPEEATEAIRDYVYLKVRQFQMR